MRRTALLLVTLLCACPDKPKPASSAAPVPAAPAPERKLTLEEEVANARLECDGLKTKLAALEGDARKGKMELLDACTRRQADLEAQLPALADGGQAQ